MTEQEKTYAEKLTDIVEAGVEPAAWAARQALSEHERAEMFSRSLRFEVDRAHKLEEKLKSVTELAYGGEDFI